MSNAILELTIRVEEQKEIYDEIDAVLNCLRLYDIGSVFIVRTEMIPKSILAKGTTSNPLHQFSQTYRYGIKENDIPKLKSLMEKLKPILRKKSSEEHLDPIAVSLQRYNDALLKTESVESRITSAITCLEALYLRAEERMELSHRLSQRSSALLKILGYKPLEIYNTLSRAYDIRSTFIHGSQIKQEEQKSAAKLAEKTIEYARLSLLVFLQLKHLLDKEKIISKIDKSLLDDKSRAKLEETIKENCKIQK